MDKDKAPPYVIALDLRERMVVVVGAGRVAERKVRGLLEAGARPVLIAPEISPSLRELARQEKIEIVGRAFVPEDLDGAVLAFAATNADDVNAQVVAAARARNIAVNDASEGERGDFIIPATYRTGSLTFAVETGGTAPSFAARLREDLRVHFDERYARAAATLAAARRYATESVESPEARAAIMRRLAELPIDELATLDSAAAERAVDQLARAERPPKNVDRSVQLVCATRGSVLALHQARVVIAKLATAGIASTILTVATRADRDQKARLDALGGENVFVKELELALRERRADYAVHSAKDLPSVLPADMRIAAIGPRADPRDVFCSERYASLDALPPGATVGTSSPRRSALLAALRPDLGFVTIRGNVDTRLRKLREGQYDAIVLAAAGLARLGLASTHAVPLDPHQVVPAVGQGALAIEIRAGDEALAERIHAAFADFETELAVTAERAFLRTLRAGCAAPVGAHARFDGVTLTLRAIVASLDGAQSVRGESSATVERAEAAESLGLSLAERLLGEGARRLLDDAAVASEGATVPTQAPAPQP